MRLIILTETSTVTSNVPDSQTGECYYYDNLDLTSCNIPSDVWALQWFDTYGHIEFKDPLLQNQNISELPSWAIAAEQIWHIKYDQDHAPPSPPTPEEIQKQNKDVAIGLLYTTDWSELPSVSDPQKSNPYLTNLQEFVVWRNNVRAVVVNPPTTVVNFPAAPKAVWSS